MLSAKQPPGGPRRAQEEIFQPGGRFVLRPRGGETLGVVPKDGPAARRLPGTIRPDPVPQRGVHLLWPGSTTPGRREPCRVVGGGGIPRPGQDGNLARKDRRSLRAGLPRREDLQSPGGCIKIDSTGRLEALREPRPAEFPARFVMSINTSRTDWRGAGQIKTDKRGGRGDGREPRRAEFPARFVMSINTSRTDWRGAGQYLYKVRKLWPSPADIEYRCISSTVGSRWPEKRELSRRPPWRSRSLVSACFL